MTDCFAVRSGAYGRVEVIENSHNLMTSASPYVHFAFWVSGGLASATVRDQVVGIGPDMALVANSHASHDLLLSHAGGPSVLLNLYLSNRWLDDQCAQMSRCLVFPQPNVPVSDAMRAACTALVETLNTAPLASAPLVEMRLMRLVSATIQAAVSAEQWANMPLRRPMIDHWLRQVIAHMQENLESPQVAEQVADMVGLSRSRLFQLFSEQLASSPSVHWSGIRLEEAVTRLHGRAPQLTDLALDLGFSTPGNFSRFFRSHRGVTPSAYRRVLQAA